MKKTLFLLTTFLCFKVFSQNFKPFIETPYFDICLHLVELDNGNFVSMEVIPGVPYPAIGSYLSSSDINDYGFSNIVLYNSTGIKLKSKTLPDTDSTSFWTSQMIQLEDGRFCLAGEHVNINTGVHNAFFAILNQSFDDFDIIKIIENTSNQYLGVFTEYHNGDIVFLSSNYLYQYTLDGIFVRQLYITPNLSSSMGLRNNLFHFNNNIYLSYIDSIKFEKIDTNFISSYHTSSLTAETINAYSFSYSLDGKELDKNTFLTKSAARNPNHQFEIDSSFVVIFKLDSFDNLTPFYVDTLNKVRNNFGYRDLLDFKSKDNIYTVYENNFELKRNFTVYSLNSSGTLNWKKYITLNSSFSTSFYTGYISTICATKDKGLIFTILIDDLYGNADTYYYKLDSLGNPTDLETGIFSLAPKIEFNDFLLYPNPVENKLNISTALKGSFKLKVFDVLGRIISNTSFENKTSINFEKIDKGNYFYTISNLNNNKIQEGNFLKK